MKPASCEGCVYYDRPGPVWPDGNPLTARLIFIGEGPGHEEVSQKKGFIGPAGYELWRLAAAVRIARNECFVTNLVKCLPVGARWGSYKLDPAAIRHCRVHLDKELAQCQVRAVIVPVGGVPLESLCGEKPITRWRGALLRRNL